MRIETLLIEDDALMAKTIEAALKSWGHTVITARSGEDALDHIRIHPFDLVVSDIQLPGINGDEVMVKAHAIAPDLPFILMTAHGRVKDAVHAIKNGAYQYLLKPIDGDEFSVIVNRALESSRIQKENQYFRSEMAGLGPSGERLIGRSLKMLEVHDMVARVARTDSTVLITGETGTGKEILAQTIHYRSPRSKKPLIAFNCAAFNENLIESELFGHEKGAFTGASAIRRGRFEDADGGTVFLDEIGETSKGFQSTLLRVLQERQFERVGGNTPIQVDVRIITSTNRNLQVEVDEGRFREDLYYRLRVVPIHLPPLRERQGDIHLLAQHFLGMYRKQYKSPVVGFSDAAKQFLENHAWKGNVRELNHTIERALVFAKDTILDPADLILPDGTNAGGPRTDPCLTLQDAVDAATRKHVVQVLDSVDWKKQDCARILGIDRATLYRLIRKYSIHRQEDHKG